MGVCLSVCVRVRERGRDGSSLTYPKVRPVQMPPEAERCGMGGSQVQNEEGLKYLGDRLQARHTPHRGHRDNLSHQGSPQDVWL